MRYCIAYDLGTGGIKASLHDETGMLVAAAINDYPTRYVADTFHEQRPEDWWEGICKATSDLLQRGEKLGINRKSVLSLAVSGHSLVAIPVDGQGQPLLEYVPIWSDTRATVQTQRFFQEVDYRHWYEMTGNGDPAECYSIFKLMWLQETLPQIYEKTAAVLGSKDYINYMFTGNMATDFSYASGSGVYNLREMAYEEDYIKVSGIRRELFLPPQPSHSAVGLVSAWAAEATGLVAGTLVACGGVDNACMALGTCGIGEGRSYASLGSSCWIATTGCAPIVDIQYRPFVFAHIEPGWFTSAVSIFSGGSSLRWAKHLLCGEMKPEEAYDQINEMIQEVPAGSGGLLFNPSLGGGSNHRNCPDIRGAFLGLNLSTTREEMLRAVYEGVALDLYDLWRLFSADLPPPDTLLLSGGGSKSQVWRQIFADVFNLNIRKSISDQHAASLGAAAIALRCAGMWHDYSPMDAYYIQGEYLTPQQDQVVRYREVYRRFKLSADLLTLLAQGHASI